MLAFSVPETQNLDYTCKKRFTDPTGKAYMYWRECLKLSTWETDSTWMNVLLWKFMDLSLLSGLACKFTRTDTTATTTTTSLTPERRNNLHPLIYFIIIIITPPCWQRLQRQLHVSAAKWQGLSCALVPVVIMRFGGTWRSQFHPSAAKKRWAILKVWFEQGTYSPSYTSP